MKLSNTSMQRCRTYLRKIMAKSCILRLFSKSWQMENKGFRSDVTSHIKRLLLKVKMNGHSLLINS
jgi:hypothetical protein